MVAVVATSGWNLVIAQGVLSMATEAEFRALAHDRNDFIGRWRRVESTCVDLPGADQWDCCETHRQLRREGEDFRQRARSMHPAVAVLSGGWWRSLNMGLVQSDDLLVRDQDGNVL